MDTRPKFQLRDRVVGADGEHVPSSVSGRPGAIVEHRPVSDEYGVQFDDGRFEYVMTAWIKGEASVSETKAEEHQRLEERTGELQKQHEALDRDRTPFNQQDHDRHAANLARHQRDLLDHQSRPDD
ncbi:MAG: hypothetical protein ABI818_08150 [Acidobacteriota bacterium]